MQGLKQFEPRLFYQVSLDNFVPQEHLVRRLANVLDFSWVRSQTASLYSHTGRPSIDPEVVAKLLLLGYLYNISSERQLMREVQVNLAYRWYLGYDLDEEIPDHSILSKARRRFGLEFFERLFEYILGCCQQAGLVRGENVLMDSTVVEANASLDSLTTLRYRPIEYWEQLERQAEPESDSDSSLVVTTQKDGTDDRLLGQKRPREQRTCDQKYSTTDPDASLYHRRGQDTRLAYKTHLLADEHKGVITAVATSSAAVDDTAMVPQLVEQHEHRLGTPKRMVGDHLYGSQDCLGYLQDRGIETVIRERKGGNAHGGFSKDKFEYDHNLDVYRCPAGRILSRRRTQKKDGKAFYSCQPGECRECKLRDKCISSNAPAAVRQVTRFDTPYVELAQAACDSSEGRHLLRRRQTCMEGLFGQGKSQHGLDRARLRKIVKMQIQGLLTAMVLNVKKLLWAVFRGKAVACQVLRVFGEFWVNQLFLLSQISRRITGATLAILLGLKLQCCFQDNIEVKRDFGNKPFRGNDNRNRSI
jgi:transposase